MRIAWAILTCLFFAWGCKSAGRGSTRLPDLEETNVHTDTNPFGGAVAYQLSQSFFNPRFLHPSDNDFEAYWEKVGYDDQEVYISITPQFFPSDAEINSMIHFLEQGNTLFISSARFSGALLDTLGVALLGQPELQFPPRYSLASVRLDSNYFEPHEAFTYFYQPASRWLRVDPKSTVHELGYNSYGYPNFVQFRAYGGSVFLHAEPELFSNYFLLQHTHTDYLQACWRYLPEAVETISWDIYYQQRKYPLPPKNRKTGLAMLFENAGMRRGFWMGGILFLLFLWFGSKRRQRVVPIRPMIQNSSVAFAETLGRLYFLQRDNRNLADKMIRHFYEHIRHQHLLHLNQPGTQVAELLSRKSAVPLPEVSALLDCIDEIEQGGSVSDQQLLQLNHHLERFKQTR